MFIESNGKDIFLPCISYNLTQTDVRLLSPHTYHQMHGGYSAVHVNQVTMHLPFRSINIPVDLGVTNIPVVHNLFVTKHQKRETGPQMLLLLAYARLSKLDNFDDLNTIRSLQNMDISRYQMII